jgi:tRNA(Ile2) C34 agmatinyltransferase TiaS
MSTVFIGMDDTDNLESRGTGQLARQAAACLAENYDILGVVRHQLLVDPRVPCTKNNSSATILLSTQDPVDLEGIFQKVKECMLADFQPGSDPGICVAAEVPDEVTDFGRRAKRELVTQEEARRLAGKFGILLEGLGGTEGGVIGALAGVGLAASGEDGRYVLVGKMRELSGLQPVEAVLAAGVDRLQTPDGQRITEGLILADRLRPARRGGLPVGVLEWEEDHWQPLKLD